jgi:hypothetical protein
LKQLRRLASGNGDVLCWGLGVVALGLGFWWLAATGSPGYYAPWTWSWAWEAMSSVSDWPALAPGALLMGAGAIMSARRLPRRVVLVAGGIVLLLLVLATMVMCYALNRAG